MCFFLHVTVAALGKGHVFSISKCMRITIYFIFPFKQIVFWNCKLLEGNLSILRHCPRTLIVLSELCAVVFGMNMVWRVQGDCWWSCKGEWTYNSVLFSQTQKHHSSFCRWSVNTCSSWWFLCTICVMHPFFLIILSSFQCVLAVTEVKQIRKNYVCYYVFITLLWEEFMCLLESGWKKTGVMSYMYFIKGTVKSH